MKAYIDYKLWWIENEGHDLVPSFYWGDTPEEAFEQHVKDLGLYKLMEKLAEWEARL